MTGTPFTTPPPPPVTDLEQVPVRARSRQLANGTEYTVTDPDRRQRRPALGRDDGDALSTATGYTAVDNVQWKSGGQGGDRQATVTSGYDHGDGLANGTEYTVRGERDPDRRQRRPALGRDDGDALHGRRRHTGTARSGQRAAGGDTVQRHGLSAGDGGGGRPGQRAAGGDGRCRPRSRRGRPRVTRSRASPTAPNTRCG